MSALLSTSASDIGCMLELFGSWSRLVLAVGFGSALACRFFEKKYSPSQTTNPITSIVVPWGMLLLAHWIDSSTLPNYAGTFGPGSTPPALRAAYRYDAYFGVLIALTFGSVYALDPIRFPEWRGRLAPWLACALNLGSGCFVLMQSPERMASF